MTAASHWRMTLAQTIAQQYALIPTVDALFLGGSTARGQADRYSDIELSVLWTTPPTEQERGQIITQLDGDLHFLSPYIKDEALWEDLFFLGRNQENIPKSGCHVEVSHYLVSTIEAAIDRVLIASEVDLELHNLMAGILESIPLLNPSRVDGWKQRLRQYPDTLQLAVIQHYGIIDHFWRWEMYVARGNNRLEIASLFTRILQQALHLLLGLNRRYFDGFKWIDTLIPHLAIAPEHLGERIRHVYELPVSDAASEVRSIVEDTFTLIEQHLPSVNVDQFRQVFSYRRPQWEDVPPLGLPL
jgi:predicted nucleotidyltransferase